MMSPNRTVWRWNLIGSLLDDRRGVSAIEFAFVAPLVFALFFGLVEITTGLAVNRKVTLAAHTLSDLTSQSAAVSTTDINSYLITGKAVLSPYSSTPLVSSITQIAVSNASQPVATVSWSTDPASHAPNKVAPGVPAALLIPGTYLILAEVSYQYVPAVAYFMAPNGITLKSSAYTRPRQSSCVTYNGAAC